MSFRWANPARGSGGKVPRTVEKAIAVGYAEERGALLTVDGSDNFVACGADPVAIAAVAIGPGGADTSGFNIVGRKEFPPYRLQGTSIADGQQFLAQFVGTIGTIGQQYGVVRDTDGFWKVDFNEIDNPVLTYVGDPDFFPGVARGTGSENLVLVEFLPNIVIPIATSNP